MPNSPIRITNLTKTFGETEVIGATSLTVADGQFVSLLGPSGSGKSTVLNIIAGLEQPTSGSVEALGGPVTGPDPERGVVFQNHALLPWLTARGNIEFGLRAARPHYSKEQRRERAETYLSKVNLGHAADRKPGQLSGGMQQRVGLARSFAIDPQILLLDEPFGALDALTRRQLQEVLLEAWEANRRTVVMVTHDVDEAILLSDRILVMSPGPHATIIEDVTVELPRPRFGLDDATSQAYTADLRRHLLGLLEQ